jgi:membrane-associated phospholipid phosphatase
MRGPPRRSRALPLLVAGLSVAVPIAAFVPLALQAWRKDVFAWDKDVSQAIHAYENRETILDGRVDPLGVVLRSPVQFLGLLVVIVVLGMLLARGRPRAGLFVALGVGGAAVFGLILKGLFERPPVDPGGEGFSFPSGHAMRSMSAAATLSIVAWPTRWRWAAIVAGAVAVSLIGIAVVYHEWHWASDVLAGWFLSIAWLGCVWLALRPSV